MELTTEQKQKVLKVLFNADGEDIETIISESGFDKYLTRAFIMKASDYDLHYYLSERKENKKQSHTESNLKQMETQNVNHRLLMIQDDLKAIREFITTNNLQDRFDLPSSRADKAITHLNNIEIACDLNSDECLSWKQYPKTNPTNKIETEFKSKSLSDTYFEIVRFITEFTNRDEYNPIERRNTIEIAQYDEGWTKLYDLAVKWSEEFDKLNKNREWDGEFVDEVEEFCKKKNVHNQEDLMDEIRAKADINIVGCGHCGGFLLHRRSDYTINCPHCDTLMDVSDCPDLIY